MERRPVDRVMYNNYVHIYPHVHIIIHVYTCILYMYNVCVYIHPDDGKCGHMCQPMVLGNPE